MELTFIHHYWYEVFPVQSLELHEQDCAAIMGFSKIENFDSIPDRGIYLATSNAGSLPAINFWKSAIESGVAYALPANFPWTLANSPCSYLARALNIRGPNYTLVGNGKALMAALRHAIRDLQDNEIQLAFVVGMDFGGIDKKNTTTGGFVLQKMPSNISLQFVEDNPGAADISQNTSSEIFRQIITKIQNRESFSFGDADEGVVRLQHYNADNSLFDVEKEFQNLNPLSDFTAKLF